MWMEISCSTTPDVSADLVLLLSRRCFLRPLFLSIPFYFIVLFSSLFVDVLVTLHFYWPTCCLYTLISSFCFMVLLVPRLVFGWARCVLLCTMIIILRFHSPVYILSYLRLWFFFLGFFFECCITSTFVVFFIIYPFFSSFGSYNLTRTCFLAWVW